GQLGRLFREHLGLEVGETMGGLLGFPLGIAFVQLFRPGDKGSSVTFGMRNWIALVVAIALANGGVLCLLLGDGPQGVEVRRVRSNEPIRKAGLGVSLSPQGRPFLVVGRDGVTRTPDVARYQKLRNQGLPVDRFTSAVFSMDGRYLLSGGKDGSVCL